MTHVPMPAVVRLETICDMREGGSDPGTMSVSARHEAVLDDGRRVLLLDGRGWTASVRTADYGAGGTARTQAEDDIWASTTVEEIERTARVVVGADEAYGDRTQAEMDAGHRRHLVEILARAGIVVDARELARLPHEVVLGARLRDRLRPSAP
jgi:hypothetical protein